MKLSSETIDIISSISRINPGAVFKRGSRIKAKAKGASTPIIFADIKEEFPRDFAIHNLKRFVQMFSLIENPELTFEEDRVILKGTGKKSAEIKYAVPSVIVHFDYNVDVVMPSEDVQFKFSVETLKSIKTAVASFECDSFAFYADGDKIYVRNYNKDNPKSIDVFSIELGDTDLKFNIIISAEHLGQFIPKDYEVKISFKGLIEFKTNDGLSYWITPSDKSKFG